MRYLIGIIIAVILIFVFTQIYEVNISARGHTVREIQYVETQPQSEPNREYLENSTGVEQQPEGSW